MPCAVAICRGCLCDAAERKLLDIRQGELDQLYQDIMRFTEPVCDHLPPYMCIYCTALLLKCVDFKRRCEKAREVLDCLLLSASTKVTNDYINIINRSSKKLTIPLTIERSAYTIECTDKYVEVKEEERESVKKEEGETGVTLPQEAHRDIVDDIKNHENLCVVIDNIKNSNENTSEIKAEDQIENKKRKSKSKLTKGRKLKRENGKISKNEKVGEKRESRINKRKKTCIKPEKKIIDISNRTNNDDSPSGEEITQTVKQVCSDSDDDMLNDITQDTCKESEGKSKKKELNEEATDNVSGDEQTEVDQIFEGTCTDNDINTVVNDVYKHNNKSKKKNEGNNKEKKQKKREYIPMMDEATFSKQFHMAVVLLTEKEQRDEFEARRNSKSYIDAPYKCNKCFRGWHRARPLNIHMEKHDPKSGRLRCDICGYHYMSMENYQRHRLSHRYKLVCQQCGFETYSRHYARLHYKRHMGHTFTCCHCGASFTSQSGQLAHARAAHAAEHAACARCGEPFLGARGLRAHLARSAGRCGPAAPALPAGSSETSDYSCPLCSKCFMSAASLEVHRQRVHLNIRFKDVRPTSEAKNLTTHICEICGKGFNAKTKLAHHQMKHEGHKPFHCSHCPKTFMSKNSLLTHTRSHSGEKPFQCTLCGRAFASQSSHWRHKMMHKEKRYKCEICDKLFTQSGSVKLHVRTVHMKLPAPPRVRGRGKGGKGSKGSESGADDLSGAMQVDPTVN